MGCLFSDSVLGLTRHSPQFGCSQKPCSWGMPLLTVPLQETLRCSKAGLAQSLVESLVSGAHMVLSEPSECLWRVQGFILNMILPLQPSCWGFSFSLGCGESFFGGIHHSPVNGCLVVSCNFFGVLTGEDECMPFYSANLGSHE